MATIFDRLVSELNQMEHPEHQREPEYRRSARELLENYRPHQKRPRHRQRPRDEHRALHDQ
jgi:hypothetical protein